MCCGQCFAFCCCLPCCSTFCCCLPLEYAAYFLGAFQIILSIFAITTAVSFNTILNLLTQSFLRPSFSTGPTSPNLWWWR